MSENERFDDEFVNAMEEKVKSLSVGSSSKCCIYLIPDFIGMQGGVSSYSPSVVTIGPVNRTSMFNKKEVKLIYLKYFLQCPLNANPSLKQYSQFVMDNFKAIHECYDRFVTVQIGGTIFDTFTRQNFVEIIMVDAAFVIYLLISNSDLVSSSIPIPKEQQGLIMPFMTKDLFLLQNQIPFFVLLKFFDLAFGHVHPPITFIHTILNIISLTSFPGYKATKSVIDSVKGPTQHKIKDASAIKHLLDLLWMCCCFHSNLSLQDCLISVNDRDDERIRYPKTAKKLSDSGVKFEVIDSDCPLNITYVKGKLMIPELVLDNDSETHLRNLLYFEQCHYSESPYINDYMLFFDKLIDTVEDVQVLQEAGILKNNLGSDKNALSFFNSVIKNTLRCQFYYSKVSEDVNAFADNSWNQSMALLKKRYFGHPWAAISVIAAILLFILTLLQTIASFTK